MPTELADIYTITKFGEVEKLREKLVEEDINKKNEHGSSLLHYAISGGKKESALFLMEKGIDVNLTNYEGQTALHLTCASGDVIIAEKILENGGDIHMSDLHNS